MYPDGHQVEESDREQSISEHTLLRRARECPCARAIALRPRDPACRKLNLARFGELARIAQQVEQNLPQPHGVHGQCPEVLLGVNDEAVLVLLGKLLSEFAPAALA